MVRIYKTINALRLPWSRYLTKKQLIDQHCRRPVADSATLRNTNAIEEVGSSWIVFSTRV
jgi:hypothetical protein